MPKRYPMTARITVGDKRLYVTPVKYYDRVIPGYFMDKDGNIYRQGKTGSRMVQPQMPPMGSRRYPRITIYENGKSNPRAIHRLVAFTLIPFEPPAEISKEEWEYICKYMPKTKRYIEESVQVNHIDAKHYNYHPSNLEWLSGRSNHKAYYRDHHQVAKAFISKCGLDVDFKMSKNLKKAM